MPRNVRAFKRTYGFAATILATLAGVAVAVGAATSNLLLAMGVLVVTSSLAVLVLSVGAVHRPRAFLLVFGDDDAADSDRTVLSTRLAGAFATAVALVVLAAGVESILTYRELVQGATVGTGGLP